MPRGYRCILIAFVGWLSLANAPNPRAAPKQPETQANQGNAAQPVLPAPNAVEPAEPSELYRPCKEGENARYSDLCAQWKAADAAREVADLTLWGLILGVIGTIGLFWTLFYTRAAVKVAQSATRDADAALAIASRNADAAAAHVAIAQDTAYRELRAYLSVEEVRLTYIGADRFSGHVVIRNAGKTPAEICVSLTGWITDFPKMNPAATGPAPTQTWRHKLFINSGSEERVQWFYPTNGEATDEIASLFANAIDRGFYLYGCIEFVDYLRNQRALHFAFRNSGNVVSGTTFPMIPCPEGNHYENRGKLA